MRLWFRDQARLSPGGLQLATDEHRFIRRLCLHRPGSELFTCVRLVLGAFVLDGFETALEPTF